MLNALKDAVKTQQKTHLFGVSSFSLLICHRSKDYLNYFRFERLHHTACFISELQKSKTQTSYATNI